MADERMPVEAEPEIVDGVIVRDSAALERRPATPVAVQAAAVAGASLVAGATAVMLAKGVARAARAPRRRSSLRLGGRRKGTRLDVVATRTFLVDVHLVDRR
ncbi:MAG TPA: hypothetical protein VNZ62_05200 [Capillimicrobium sp.]|nr:hypothetical protein [Capillimicrobium sp.]